MVWVKLISFAIKCATNLLGPQPVCCGHCAMTYYKCGHSCLCMHPSGSII